MTKYLGLISVIILIFGLLFTVLRWKGGLHMTFSQHVAPRRISAVYYSLLFAVTLPLLFIFFTDWFVPTFHLPIWFVIFMTISVTSQFLCTLFPEVGGWRTKVHKTLAGISALMLLPLVVIFATSPDVLLVGRVLSVVSFVGMMAIVVIGIKNRKEYRYALLLQTSYYALFFVPTLYIAYV